MQAKPGARYENAGFPKDDVRDALLKEQGYLCAYCMSRITKCQMKIEHRVPQNGAAYYPEYTQQELDELGINYTNMLGVCKRVVSMDGKTFTICDTHRQEHRIEINALLQASIDKFTYTVSGEIDSADIQTLKDIKTLNLNVKRLTANRLAAWKACQGVLKSCSHRGSGQRRCWKGRFGILNR